MSTGRLTGICGITVAAFATVSLPLYFVYDGDPPTWNVLTRIMLNLLATATLAVFLAGMRQLIRTADPESEWLATLMFGAGLVYAAVTMVAGSLEAGVVFDARGVPIDPTIHGSLASANVLLHGSISRLLTAVLLFAGGYAIRRSRCLPRWTSHAAFVVATVNLAFVPSLYTTTDPAQFYSALGWGNTALAAALITYWALAVGISALIVPARERHLRLP